MVTQTLDPDTIASKLAQLTHYAEWQYERGRFRTENIAAISNKARELQAILFNIAAQDRRKDVMVEHITNLYADENSPMYVDRVSISEEAIDYTILEQLALADA